MATPVITDERSYVGARVGRYTEGNLAVDSLSAGTPVWTLTGQPPGITIDADTGRWSGTPTVDGIFTARIQVTSAAAEVSLAKNLLFHVLAGTVAGTLYNELWIDLHEGDVWGSDPTVFEKPEVFSPFIVRGDKKPYRLRFVIGNALVDPGTITSVKWWFKELDSSPVICKAETWAKTGVAAAQYWDAVGDFTDKKIRAALSYYYGDISVGFDAPSEIEIRTTVDGEDLIISSKKIIVRFEKDMVV